jgi:uncharacterized membrane protein YkoI
MVRSGPVFVAAFLALAVAPAPSRAEEAAHPAHGIEAAHPCVNQKERRLLVENGSVLHLAAAMHAVRSHVAGALVRARLCRRAEGYAYVLTMLAHDGKVTRVVVDAVKGTLVGER